MRRSHPKPAPSQASIPASEPHGYLYEARRPLNSLLFILIPLTAYQVFAFKYGTRLLAPQHLARVLEYFGATAALLPPALIVAVLLAQHFVYRRRWTPQPLVQLGMLEELPSAAVHEELSAQVTLRNEQLLARIRSEMADDPLFR